jgi:hypothetical protein
LAGESIKDIYNGIIDKITIFLLVTLPLHTGVGGLFLLSPPLVSSSRFRV